MVRRVIRLLPALTLALVALPASARAQVASSWLIGGGSGLGWGTMSVESDIGTKAGPVVFVLMGRSRGGVRLWSVEAEAQPFRVPNPVEDERFRAFRGLVRRSFGHPFFVAPGAGVELRRWYGTARRDDVEVNVYLSASAGRHVPVGARAVLLPEISWGYSPLGRAGAGSGAAVSLRISAFWER